MENNGLSQGERFFQEIRTATFRKEMKPVIHGLRPNLMRLMYFRYIISTGQDMAFLFRMRLPA